MSENCGMTGGAAAWGTINLHQPAGRLKLGIIQNKIKT